ncbi:DM9 repeat-containing protein [Roseomonas elaeocarpi]|uniref:DM9 repeat-containing protein n=1 Tax=Roseomonas elaeocarpi TaxID=907779 RepID=A0ABV6JLN8_9PROT
MPADLQRDRTAAMRDMLPLGQENNVPLYACRGRIGNGVHIGRIRSDFPSCHIGYDGRELEVKPYEVLSLAWVEAANGSIPAQSLSAGQAIDASTGGRFVSLGLYPCRASYQTGVHVGEVRPGGSGCVFGFGGKEVSVATYEVLQLPSWVAWTEVSARSLPVDAIVGGSEGGEPLYVCRAADRNGIRLGKVRANSGGCSIASEGRELVVSRFEVPAPRWARATASPVLPTSAVPAGRENEGLLYLCRVQRSGMIQIGKAGPELSGCHVGMQGREVVYQEFEVLGR